MIDQEIPPSDWQAVFEQFSRGHHGQNVEVRTTGAGVGERWNMSDLPLLGITLEQRAGQEPCVDIAAADPGGPHVSHSVFKPVYLQAREWNDGFSAELKIDSEDGRTTWVRVGPAEQLLPPGVITDGLYERD